MILDIQTIPGGITLRGTDMFFTKIYLPTGYVTHNSFQLCVELDEQLIIFDCRDTTIDGISYANSTAFRSALNM